MQHVKDVAENPAPCAALHHLNRAHLDAVHYLGKPSIIEEDLEEATTADISANHPMGPGPSRFIRYYTSSTGGRHVTSHQVSCAVKVGLRTAQSCLSTESVHGQVAGVTPRGY
jgi:hypothetical protein